MKSSRRSSHRRPLSAAAALPPPPRRRTPAPQRLPWPTIVGTREPPSSSSSSQQEQEEAPPLTANIPDSSSFGAATTETNNKERPPPSKRPATTTTTTTTTTPQPIGSSSHKKRTRQVTFRAATATALGGSSAARPPDDRLWIDAHAPTTVDELCVAPKKIRELRNWLLVDSSSSTAGLLIVVGNPGIGKSTAVQCVARELQRPILEWSESVASHLRAVDSPDLAQPSPLDSLEQFLRQARAGYGAIPTHTTTTTTTTIALPPPSSGPPVILLDELPNLHGRDMEERFRDLFTQHVVESSSSAHRTPTVWIYSRVSEGKHQKEDLERLVEPRVLYDPQYCQILSIHPPTKSRFVKIIDRIAAQRAVRNVQSSALYEACGGDVRFAITALQLEGPTVGHQRLTDPRRDERLNPFHALGKLLYAKRKPSPPPTTTGEPPSTAAPCGTGKWWKDERPHLDFDPDSVLDRSEMELPQALQFLEYHAIDFMTDLIDVSQVLSCYSDAACLCDRLMTAPHGSRGSAAYQSGPPPAAVAIASRAVAAYNFHPAPSRFRQFGAPRIFEVLRKRSANREQLRHALAHSPRLLGVDQYATDCLSLVRKIRPDRPLAWQSYLGPSTSNGEAAGLFEAELPSHLVLDDDDIDEFSDRDESHDSNSTKKEIARESLDYECPKPTTITPSFEETTATSPNSSASSPL